jgi:hypothetical protein
MPTQNPYHSPSAIAVDSQTAISDLKTTFAFWTAVIFGAASWVCLGLCYRFALEGLYVAPPPWFGYWVAPGCLASGFVSLLLMAYGHKRRSEHPEHRWSTVRFVIAGVPAALPAGFLLLVAIDS